MGVIRRWIEKRDYLQDIKKHVLDIETMEQIAKVIYLPSERKKYIRDWIQDYNSRNVVDIPTDMVLRLYEIKYEDKNGDIKKEFVSIIVDITKQTVIRYLPELIDLALKILFK